MSVFTALIAGISCKKDIPNNDFLLLDQAQINKVVVQSYEGGQIITNAVETNTQAINVILQAMKSAELDNNLYDTPLMTILDFYSYETFIDRAAVGGSLFRLGKNQYYEKSGLLETAIGRIKEKQKDTEQAR